MNSYFLCANGILIISMYIFMRSVSISRNNWASSVCVQTNAPRARWGSTPIPFDIAGETGDELSGKNAT